MHCLNCGADIPDDSKFCPKCDMPVETAAAMTKAPVKRNGKLLLLAGIAAILVIFGSCFFLATQISKLSNTEDNRFSYTDSPLIIKGEEETLIYNGSGKPAEIPGCYTSSAFSMDKRKCVLMMDQEKNGPGTLYYYDGSEAKELSDDVFMFTISADGSGVAYLTDLKEDYSGTLHIYDASGDKSREVAEDAGAYMILSPDGKSIAYISDLTSANNGNAVESFTSYVSVNGKTAEPLGSDALVIGLANDAKYVYYLQNETGWQSELTLYVQQGKTNKELGSSTLNMPFTFNRDLSEILYADDGKTYLSRATGDKEMAADCFLLYIYVPDNSQMSNLSSYMNNFDFAMYNVTDLTGQSYLYKDSDDLRVGYLDKEFNFSETGVIANIINRQTQWTADGKGLYYPDDNGRLQYLRNVTNPDSKPVKIEDGPFAERFIVTSDQSTVYFVDQTGTLWIKKGYSDPVAVAEKVMDNSLTLASDGQGLYFIADSARDEETNNESGTLSYLSGSPDAKVSRIADNVAYVTASKAGIAYYMFGEMGQGRYMYEVFYSVDGKNFSSVMDNAYFS